MSSALSMVFWASFSAFLAKFAMLLVLSQLIFDVEGSHVSNSFQLLSDKQISENSQSNISHKNLIQKALFFKYLPHKL
jgi:hypothetical protein